MRLPHTPSMHTPTVGYVRFPYHQRCLNAVCCRMALPRAWL
jgi:hypothetical protein